MNDQLGNPLFSLDIGTRKVTALLTEETPRGIRIIKADKIEHNVRSMYDGQIHDVGEVARVVRLLKSRIEKATGIEIRKASVAAAGRALKTANGRSSREISRARLVDASLVLSLEMEAVQDAQSVLAQKEKMNPGKRVFSYQYVGHNATHYAIDGVPLKNLIGQRGELIEIEVIATFLPEGVIDSLANVLDLSGLEMMSLTLEPIAAISVTVPPTSRHLNIALIDIGAGTSDIAISRDGFVCAYDMVPIAGDEVTEAISRAFLLDFIDAEKIKRQISACQEVTFVNLLGSRVTVPCREIIKAIEPTLDGLAREISERITRLNGGPPEAVILVGGGSLTPNLPQALSRSLSMPPSRIGVRGRDAITGVTGAKRLLGGPDCITPIGIALTAGERSKLGFIQIRIGSATLRIFNASHTTVGSALLAAGIRIKDLHGKIGPGITITVNGKLQLIKGSMGKPAQVALNGKPASLNDPIATGDEITIIPPEDGKPATARIKDFISSDLYLRIRINGEEHIIPPEVTVNGSECDPEQDLNDNDAVVITPRTSVGEVLRFLAESGGNSTGTLENQSGLTYSYPNLKQKGVRYTINSRDRIMPLMGVKALRNGKVSSMEDRLETGDYLELVEPAFTIEEAVTAEGVIIPPPLSVTLNGKTVDIPLVWCYRNGEPASLADHVRDGDRIEVRLQTEPPVLAHALERSGFNVAPPPGKVALNLEINGVPAGFSSVLKAGDKITTTWG